MPNLGHYIRLTVRMNHTIISLLETQNPSMPELEILHPD